MREKMEAIRKEEELREKTEAEHAQNERGLEFAKAMQEDIDKEDRMRDAAAAQDLEVTNDPDSNPLLLPRQNNEPSR